MAIRTTAAQKRTLFAQLVSAGDVWCCVLELNRLRGQRGDRPVVSYKELCRELSKAGPGCFGELSAVGARSVLKRYSDAWFAAAKAHKQGERSWHFPRRKRHLVPVRFYCGTFSLEAKRLTLPVGRGWPSLSLRLTREVPYPSAAVRSVTLLCAHGRLYVDVTAEVEVSDDHTGHPRRVLGVDLGVIHPYAVAGPDGKALLVSGRALRAESYLHLRERKARSAAVARRAPRKGQRGSRRWRQFRRRSRALEGRHRRRLSQARHEAAKAVVDFAVAQGASTLVVGDPAGVLEHKAGAVHNQRLRDWGVGQLKSVLADKAELSGIEVVFVDERGSSSTCPLCRSRVPKPSGRRFFCPQCHYVGHRDLVGAVNIASRDPRGGTVATFVVATSHRRGGQHLPGAGRSRRDPRRTRLVIKQRQRGSWPAVARPEEQPLGSSSIGILPTIEDQPTTTPERAHVG